MKTVCIIAGDTLPFKLKKDSGNIPPKDYDDYFNSTFYGIRHWEIAQFLSKNTKLDVTLLVPDVYYPEIYFKADKIEKDYTFKIDTFNYKIASWRWSQELDRKLKKFDFVICPTYNGVGLENCSVLPGEVNLIVDGWNVLPLEYSARLLSYSKIARKVAWSNFKKIYSDLITRSNCLLYANDKQRDFYQGLFFGYDKLNYNAFQFSPVLKIPFGVDKKEVVKEINTEQKNSLSLLYQGSLEPWDHPEFLYKKMLNNSYVNINFANLEHPRHNKIYNSYFKPFFNNVNDIHNIEITSSRSISYIDYDYSIFLSRNWVIDSYIHRPEILESLSYKLPVIVNKTDSIYNEIEFLQKSMLPIKLDSMEQNLTSLRSNDFTVDDQQLEHLLRVFSWSNVLTPLLGYIENFS